jgi:hypothetical protein
MSRLAIMLVSRFSASSPFVEPQPQAGRYSGQITRVVMLGEVTT